MLLHPLLLQMDLPWRPGFTGFRPLRSVPSGYSREHQALGMPKKIRGQGHWPCTFLSLAIALIYWRGLNPITSEACIGLCSFLECPVISCSWSKTSRWMINLSNLSLTILIELEHTPSLRIQSIFSPRNIHWLHQYCDWNCWFNTYIFFSL